MGKKTQGRKSRQGAIAPKGSSLKFIGSPRSQGDIKEQWRLESVLTTCEAQSSLWQRKLATAEEGVLRNTAQISAGHGYGHSVLQANVKEVAEAKQMIASFKEHAVKLQKQIDSLIPDAAKAAERAGKQKVVAEGFLAREGMDRKLDSALEVVRQILRERAALTSILRDGTESLGFGRNIDLDDERFETLLEALPQKMAAESLKFVKWFLGLEGGRRPYRVHGGTFVLRETLHCHNAFASGDFPELTEEEMAAIEQMRRASGPSAPPVEAPPKRLGEEIEEVPPSKIQWGLPARL